MAEIRLNKIMRQFNIGLQDLVDFLKAQGADVEENPNAKFSDEYLPAIQKQFGADLKAAEEANERAIKMSDILENSGRRREEPVEEEEEEREKASVSHWAVRLAEYPEEAEGFENWSELTPEDWIFLLPKQPQFAKRCRWDELPEYAADRIVARCPKLRRYKVWDETYEDEEGNTQTHHHDDAAAERGIAALGDPNFWKSFSSLDKSDEGNGNF